MHELLSQFNNKSDEFDRAISRAIEKEGKFADHLWPGSSTRGIF